MLREKRVRGGQCAKEVRERKRGGEKEKAAEKGEKRRRANCL